MASKHLDQINLQQTSSHSYSASSHEDWCVGPVLLGSTVATVLHIASLAHLNGTLAEYKQPDVHTLHVEFLRPSMQLDFEIKVTDLKVGTGVCFIQLDLSQDREEKAIALCTSTNFDVSLGPSAETGWVLHPPVGPVPDMKKIDAQLPEENWVSGRIFGEILPLTRRMFYLYPRKLHPDIGLIDFWMSFNGDERFLSATLPLAVDLVPSPTDTILGTGGEFDGRSNIHKSIEWAKQNPGVPLGLENTLEGLFKKSHLETTLCMNLEFKERLPKDGLRWVLLRTRTKMLQNGRLDLDVTICNEDLRPLCFARQVMLSHDVVRRFRVKSTVPNL
ncbi:hypothetical protein NW762_014588 [Fusarium torreyae]|uniref:Thioesterase family protein n=1 Tax=Fusarium torreyae TaxID=1237075 RepID=A0A9W8RLE7_9HYPO|nr:hypothetical protein NW762_014588 [Fusarium torreyae]